MNVATKKERNPTIMNRSGNTILIEKVWEEDSGGSRGQTSSIPPEITHLWKNSKSTLMDTNVNCTLIW